MNTVTDLFSVIESLIPNLGGWCSERRACELAALVLGMQPKYTVCIGVWHGRDTFALALAHKVVGIGHVTAIDPWLAGASIADQDQANVQWWGRQEIHEEAYNTFLANRKSLELEDQIIVERQMARDVDPASTHSEESGIGLLIVDGNHGPESIVDVDKFAPHVANGGIVYMDDINWSGGAVAEAVQHLERFNFVQLYKRDTGAFFQRRIG